MLILKEHNSNINFPVICKHIESDEIWVFARLTTAMCIKDPSTGELEDYSDICTPCTDGTTWEILEGYFVSI